jgi:hypothetical protein
MLRNLDNKVPLKIIKTLICDLKGMEDLGQFTAFEVNVHDRSRNLGNPS